MNIILITLTVLICCSTLIKQTFQSIRGTIIVSLLCFCFVIMSLPWVIEISYTQISGWMADAALRQNISAILILEVTLQISFSMLAAHLLYAGKVPMRTIWTYRILRNFPGLLCFPALFLILAGLIVSTPGQSFTLTALIMASTVLVLIPVIRHILLWMIPEKDMRLELLFLINATMGILAIAITIDGQASSQGQSDTDWNTLAAILAIVVFFSSAGYFHYLCKKHKKSPR